MSAIAKYLLENNCEVSGSDINENKYTEKLRKMGATVYIGHDATNVPDGAKIVASTAIRENNPEIIRAKELGLKIYHRSDILAEISRSGKLFFGFSGTHGKTTTSGLCSYVLQMMGEKPSYVLGGTIPELGVNSHCQEGKHFVAELDESDGTVVKYAPNVCVINNLEADHLDFYKEGIKSILETFEKFISNMDEKSVLLVNNDCKEVMELKSHPLITFGLNDADYVARNIEYKSDCTTFDIYYKGEFLTDLSIILRGKHNVYNSLAVFASLHQVGIDMIKAKPHFSTFSGMGRRFEKALEFGGVEVYDDYAHHPTEIKATLESAKSIPNKNVVAVFQPHRYSRMKNLWNDFLQSFEQADRVIVTDIFAASEDVIEELKSENFTEELKSHTNAQCEYIPGPLEEVAKVLYPTLKPDDIVVNMGAGSIVYLAKELAKIVR